MIIKHRNTISGNEEKPDSGGWEVVYTGFILILLCFFVMMCALSIKIEEEKVMRFVKSFANVISIGHGGIKFDASQRILTESPDIMGKQNEIATFSEKLKKSVKIFYSGKQVVMRLSDTALFDIGSAEISPEAIPLLMDIGTIISKTSYNIRIEGHTDNIPIHTGRFPSNWELSTSRAVNFLRYLIENCNISTNRLSAVGFGEYHPILPNDSSQHRTENRRWHRRVHHPGWVCRGSQQCALCSGRVRRRPAPGHWRRLSLWHH